MKKPISREEFIIRGAFVSAIALVGQKLNAMPTESNQKITAREYLKEIIYSRQEVKSWLEGKAFPFAKYDGELGWLLPDAHFRDGLAGSVSTYTYGPYDERKVINYQDRTCRINTYGDSFTQCHQVSYGETWQEVLAAHLQEPIRNFGIGGWSVYQAYLRMLREEARVPAQYIIFNIYDDDHFRNLDSWRNIRVRKHVRFIEPTLPYVKVNAHREEFTEHANPCPTPESVYNLCDLNWIYENFKDDFTLKIMLAHMNSKQKVDSEEYAEMVDLATTHGIKTRLDSSETLEHTADVLHKQSAIYASQKIVEKVEQFAAENDKKVLYVVSYPAPSVAKYVREGTRWDQPFVDFLKQRDLAVVDLMEAHVAEFNNFKLGIDEYLKRYFIGHYNPRGNLFCAYAIKDKLVQMLNPKPFPYRQDVIDNVLD